MYNILVINPGSTSTKIALFDRKNKIAQYNIEHSAQILEKYKKTIDQLDYRYDLIVHTLSKNNIDLQRLSIIMARGGMLPPLQSGVYAINSAMIDILTAAQYGEHASNLGAIIAHKLADKIPHAKSYIANPVSVDELSDVARIGGLPSTPRRSIFHALNHKAVAHRHAQQMQQVYENLNLIVAHIGGGISVAAHRQGRVVDVNQGLDGTGAIAPERSGTLDAGLLVKMCFSGQYTEQELLHQLAGKGGLYAHLGSKDVAALVQKANNGDQHTALILQAMAYTIGKEIGSMYAVLKGKCDGILLTGGVAHSTYIITLIRNMVGGIAPLFVYPGEDEMVALAESGQQVLDGKEVFCFG